MQPLLQRKLEHGELDAEGQVAVGGEVDGDEIKVLGREGGLAEVVEGGLGEQRQEGDGAVGPDRARPAPPDAADVREPDRRVHRH